MPPELSVVIPTYDTAAMTLRCCRAVLASMPPATEVLVADDGSRDGTAELLAREAPSVRVVRLETNRGFATAANQGIAATTGRIVLVLNSDAIVDADALHALVAAFDADARLGVAGARLLNEDRTPQWSGGRTPALAWMIGVVSGAGPLLRYVRRRRNGQRARDVDWVSGAAMAFRREVWNDAGPLSERFLFYCQDIDFCLRARRAGWHVRIIDDARVTHALGRTIAAQHALPHDPERLWPDLLTWGRDAYGRRWGAVARVALVAAAAMRVVVRGWPVRRDGTTSALLRATRRVWGEKKLNEERRTQNAE
jgi:N-acetylglucosaminyl-diphospho-decaprenol L-rhamnosyltransferase